MRIVHSGDWHLNNKATIAGRFILQDGINLALLDRILAIRKICEYVEENDVDLVVIAGDLFDNSSPENVAIKVAVEAVETLAEMAPVIIVRGNHDGQKGSEVASALAPFGSVMKRFGIHVSERPETFSFLIKNRKANIFTLPYPRKSALKSDPRFKAMSPEELSVYISRKMEEILSGFRAQIERDAVNILVGHFTVAGSVYSKEQSVPPFDISIRKEFLDPFNIVCLDHLHESQPYYSGTIARNGFGEENMKVGFKVHEIQDGKVTEQFIELPAREYVTVSAEEFARNGLSLSPEAAVRIKGKVPKHEYDEIVRKMRALNIPFLKNAIEIETETAGVGGDIDVSEEPDIEQAVRMWAQGRDGMDRFLNRLVGTAKEIEAKFNERR